MLLAGFVVTFVLWRGLQEPLANPMLERENYRGEAIPTALGFVGVLGFVAVTAAAGVLESLGWVEQPVATSSRNFVLPVVLGFALLGLFDDLAGSGHHRGFGGHAAELGRGRVTTGMLKLLGGALVALAGVAMLNRLPHTGWLLVDAAIVALAANLANLLDRAPGRTTKVALVAFVVLGFGTGAWTLLAGPALLLGAVLALLIPELAERGMVGDTGANALGAALGMGVVLTCSEEWRVVVLVALTVVNLASEWVSFSSVIDAVRPLRWLDRWGNRRPRAR
jgi:UDP-N-acetylmuramyl pentapeptide phosphotransferase/UDP-N-acetylglucosamine-1-phosphate transferase